MTQTISKETVKNVLAGKILPDTLDRNTARLVLRELQAGRCKGNPKLLLTRRLARMARYGWTPKALDTVKEAE
jgi:hypothetical protein